MIDFRQNKQDYITVFSKLVLPKYPQAQKILDWLETTDFYMAPASTSYHSAEAGGLCWHHLLVFDSFYDIIEGMKIELPKDIGDAEIALMTLTHDFCKIFMYTKYSKNVKKEIDGKLIWTEELAYKVEEQFPYGHGEKSVYYLMKFINNLPDCVYQAIRFHMGGMETPMIDRNSSPVMAQNKLALILHMADLYATFALEERKDTFLQKDV